MTQANNTRTTLHIGGKEKSQVTAFILGETEKAFKVELGFVNFEAAVMATRVEWFPKSQVKLINANDCVYLDVTPWIAMQKGVTPV
jgi:hypothetical protein